MADFATFPVPAFACEPIEAAGLLVDAECYYREFYRAASSARRSILLSGWQFDSKVALLRGKDVPEGEPPRLLEFLNSLCEAKPELVIKIMAWDFNLVFAAEREWMQKVAFHWMTHERISFRFDSNHVDRGCHHQKFAVIDGTLSFLGGLDLCDHRWDSRAHEQNNPLRVSRGEPHQPFHDIQAFVKGDEVAAALGKLFACRWERAGGHPIAAELLVPPKPATVFPPTSDLMLEASEVYLSRTDPFGSPDGHENCAEIKELHVEAIARAETLIYLETQYFSSREIAEALVARMHAHARSTLQIVMVLNLRGETLKEQAAVGLAQAQIIGQLRQVAEATGHSLGIYYTVPSCDAEARPDRATYIHSKLMIVDDQFLTVGSANLTNRSMAVDTELNLTVQSDDSQSALSNSIRAVRVSLLAEHSGGAELAEPDELVQRLDRVAARGDAGHTDAPCRLRRHPSPTADEKRALQFVDPQSLPFDPDEDDLNQSLGGPLMRRIERSIRDLVGSGGHG